MGGRTVMSLENDAVPSKSEVATQLQRMLADPVFKSHPKQAEVFAFIVRSELEGREVSEKSIRAEIFPDPPYNPLINHVTVTVLHVRGRIAEYYAGPGGDDRVVITLLSRKGHRNPPGKAYTPTFAYNSQFRANEEYRRGLFHIGQLEYRPDVTFASNAFQHAIAEAPDYGPAHAAIAEVHLLKAFFTYQVPPGEFLAAAEAAARVALRSNENLWKANIVLGAAHCCRWNWETAEEHFKRAGEVGLDEALESPWWAAFLLAGSIANPGGDALVESGEPMSLSEAFRPRPPIDPSARVIYPGTLRPLHAMKERARKRPGDAIAHCVHGLFRHVVRDFLGEGLASATAAIDGDYQNWFLHVLHELSVNVLDLRRESTVHSGEPPYNLVYPISYMAILENDRFLTPCCPGLAIVFASSRGLEAEARVMLERLESESEHSYVRPFQLALGHLALGNHQRALKELSKAADERDPYIVWLHLWPLLDSLRKHPEFKVLINRMDLPFRYL